MHDEKMVELGARNLTRRLLEILERTEETDSGIVFHPTYISSCRVVDSTELAELLPALRAAVYDEVSDTELRCVKRNYL